MADLARMFLARIRGFSARVRPNQFRGPSAPDNLLTVPSDSGPATLSTLRLGLDI